MCTESSFGHVHILRLVIENRGSCLLRCNAGKEESPHPEDTHRITPEGVCALRNIAMRELSGSYTGNTMLIKGSKESCERKEGKITSGYLSFFEHIAFPLFTRCLAAAYTYPLCSHSITTTNAVYVKIPLLGDTGIAQCKWPFQSREFYDARTLDGSLSHLFSTSAYGRCGKHEVGDAFLDTTREGSTHYNATFWRKKPIFR